MHRRPPICQGCHTRTSDSFIRLSREHCSGSESNIGSFKLYYLLHTFAIDLGVESRRPSHVREVLSLMHTAQSKSHRPFFIPLSYCLSVATLLSPSSDSWSSSSLRSSGSSSGIPDSALLARGGQISCLHMGHLFNHGWISVTSSSKQF